MATAAYALNLKGKKIALMSEARPEFLQAYLATLCTNAVIVPLDKELMPDQILGFLKVAECSALFISPECKRKLGEVLNDAKLDYVFVMSEEEYTPYVGSYEDFASKKEINFYEMTAYGKYLLSAGFMGIYNLTYDPEAMAAILFTSGTTGTSKGVMLSHKNLLVTASQAANNTPFAYNDVFLSVLPMHHTYETTIDIAILHIGCTVCINNSIKYVLRNLKRFKPTGFVLVPLFVQTIHKRIFDEIKKKGKQGTFNKALKLTKGLRKVKIDLRRPLFSEIISSLGGRLKTIICGGAGVDPELLQDFKDMGINIYQGFGITECSPLVSVDLYTRPKIGSVGPAIPCCDVKVLKEVNGELVPTEANEIGEIAVKGDNVMLGYYNDPAATEASFTEDGYFLTGDLGKLDEDGYIYITGRKKNLIILSNGKNVYPEEIEEYLLRIECINECAVVARTNNLGEAVVTAIIVPKQELIDGCSENELQEEMKKAVLSVNEKLPSFKQIRNVEIRRSEFDKTSTKKIKRFML